MNAVTGYYYFDTAITTSALLTVTLATNVNATMYNISQNLNTLQILQLTNSIKFITGYTVATVLTGTNINGSCVGTCYLQFASSAATVAVSVGTIAYTITIEGYLTQVILNPTFVL
jgi:hypothetical protein